VILTLAVLILGVTAAIAFFLGRYSKQPLEPSIPSPLRDRLQETLQMLEGGVTTPGSLPELLERVDMISRNLQGRYDVLTTNLAAAVVVYDENTRIRFVSPYSEVLTGYAPEDFYSSDGDIFEEIAVDEDRNKYARAKQVSKLGEDFQLQYQVRHRSGLRLWLDTRFVPIFDEGDQVLGLLCVTIDVTESIRQRKQLEQQNQDLSDFSYMVSHDLKAPIFTIKGMVAALKEDFNEKLGPDGDQLVSYICEAAHRLEKLVSSVIEYSAISIRDGVNQAVPLNDVLKSVLQDFTEQIRTTASTISAPEDLPIVRGDPVRFYQVFSNLIGNAIKYREPSRPLQVKITAKEASHDLTRIEVEDNGRGIPEGKVKDVFRPYHRAHSSEIEGSGIGLASVKKIVEKGGGQVSVESKEGVGSTFRVTLPLFREEPNLTTVAAAASQKEGTLAHDPAC